MSRLIDADDPKLRGKLKFIREAEGQIYGRASWCFSAKCEAAIDDAQTVDAVPVRYGHWIEDPYDWECQCSECGHLSSCRTVYCSACGARMDGKDGDRHDDNH